MAAAAVGVGVFLAQSQHGSFPRPVTRLPAALVTTTTEEKLRRDSATSHFRTWVEDGGERWRESWEGFRAAAGRRLKRLDSWGVSGV